MEPLAEIHLNPFKWLAGNQTDREGYNVGRHQEWLSRDASLQMCGREHNEGVGTACYTLNYVNKSEI